MLGEFLSANVSTPFLLFMVEGSEDFVTESALQMLTVSQGFLQMTPKQMLVTGRAFSVWL